MPEHMNPPNDENIDADKLMREYKATGDYTIRNQLVMYYSKYINMAIYSMRSILLSNIPFEDFFNQGVLALMEGIEKFDPDRGASFNTFVYKRVRGALLNYMRRQNWLPNRVRDARREIMAARAALQGKLLREPTDEEIAEYLDMPLQKLSSTMAEIATADSVSLEEMIEENYTTMPALSDETEGAAVEDQILRSEMQEILAKAIAELSPKQQQVITMCYYENLNLREMGEILGLTQQRISQIRTSALAQLKSALEKYNMGHSAEHLMKEGI